MNVFTVMVPPPPTLVSVILVGIEISLNLCVALTTNFAEETVPETAGSETPPDAVRKPSVDKMIVPLVAPARRLPKFISAVFTILNG